MRRHLLVTNDFPPKVGGIQSYLWELWRRLPGDDVTVYTTPYSGSEAFDCQQPFRVERSPEPFLLPYPWLAERIGRVATEVGAEMVMLDPALPLGFVGPHLDRPYGVVLHGAETTVPARLPIVRSALRRVLTGASLVVSAGDYARLEAERCARAALPSIVVPPGVDTARFAPLSSVARAEARQRFGVSNDELIVASVNRLVPRKGLDVALRAVTDLARRGTDVRLLVGGRGRDASRLAGLAADIGAPVTMLGRLADEDVASLYGAADVMAMLCHDRWWGLEQEGFGIAFLEAAAAGIPQIAGRSGGAAEAVEHGVTGLVVDDPRDQRQVTSAFDRLLSDTDLRHKMGAAARDRAVDEFDYDLLARRLAGAIDGAELP